MYFDFNTVADEKIKIKMDLSPVSQGDALENIRAEVQGWDFNKIKQQAQADWEKELEKIKIEASKDDKINFYTVFIDFFSAGSCICSAGEIDE